MRKFRFILLALSLFIICPAMQAQKAKGTSGKKGKEATTYDITFNIKGAKDTIVYLTLNFEGKLMLRDSAKASSPGVYRFKNSKKLECGFYTLVAQKRIQYASFIIDKLPFSMIMDMDTTGDPTKMAVHNSPENAIVVDFQKQTVKAQQEISDLNKDKQFFEQHNQTDSVEKVREKMSVIDKRMKDYIAQLIEEHPDYLFVKMQKAYSQFDVPEFKDAEGNMDNEARAAYYRAHYWDNFDLGDGRMVFMPVMQGKTKEYFERVLQYQEVDTINKYIDLTVDKCTDTLTYQYMINYLSHHFESSKNLGHDAVFIHIAKNNQLKGKCFWMDEDLIEKYRKRVERLEPLLIGQHAKELLIPDTSDNWHSSHALPKEYVIIWFFDPDCPECRKETKKLRKLYDSLQTAGTRNFDVFAIANDCTPERWKRYVKEEGHPWLVVGGNKGNIDYLDAYNTYETGNPSMFILNKKRDIICNKRIPIEMIPSFLEQYEKIEENKLKRAQGN
jgi:peroxiredoxin